MLTHRLNSQAIDGHAKVATSPKWNQTQKRQAAAAWITKQLHKRQDKDKQASAARAIFAPARKRKTDR